MIVMPIWLQLLFLLGFPIMFFVTLAAWIIDYIWLTPKEAKIVKKAARKKLPLVVLGGDDGYADLDVLQKRGKAGYGSTSKKPKDAWTGFYARSVEEEREPTNEEKEKEKAIVRLINKLSSRKLFLRHAKVPVWFGYSGKAILTSLYSLIGLDLLKETTEKIGNPKAVIDLTEIRSLFDKPWDESQIRGYGADSKDDGIFETKKFSGVEGMKYFVLPGMIIIAIIILAIIFLVLGK